MEISCSLSSIIVLQWTCQRFVPDEIQQNSDSSLLLRLRVDGRVQGYQLYSKENWKRIDIDSYLVSFAISFDCCSMRQYHMMCCNIRFSGRIACCTVPIRLGAPTRWIQAAIEPERCNDPWFIKGHPIFHSVTKYLETKLSIISKILPASVENKAIKPIVSYKSILNRYILYLSSLDEFGTCPRKYELSNVKIITQSYN